MDTSPVFKTTKYKTAIRSDITNGIGTKVVSNITTIKMKKKF